MQPNYKYDPGKYKDIPCLEEDFKTFFELLSIYENDKSTYNALLMTDACDTLFFTIKAREIEGFLTCDQADELRIFLRGTHDVKF
jgi:hypothetical protein